EIILKNRNTGSIMEQVKKQTCPGSIILMHDIHQTTINALPSVIEYLQKNGYTLITVTRRHTLFVSVVITPAGTIILCCLSAVNSCCV
ncbi:Polysaccharide deacetylase, partial [human gut metagenome]